MTKVLKNYRHLAFVLILELEKIEIYTHVVGTLCNLLTTVCFYSIFMEFRTDTFFKAQKKNSNIINEIYY